MALLALVSHGGALFFHHAPQRVLGGGGKVHNLCHLVLCGFIGGWPYAIPHAVVVDVKHGMECRLVVLSEEALHHVDDELHRGLVVVHDEHPVEALAERPLVGFRRHFFSITHCRGCWCLRAKSITCVTFVSATS